ncbi:polyhydroxyalkanoate synthase [Paralcaligenes ureilyticus]|uniref:Polyhydroxyalkanoate synthase n=1 Tax=Paralcaligenes ureilyticus TaxID=627131 RepID=A0A4R3MAI0_9BURK|nr:polyhydroxyalkanoate synthase [Paralcaligenes ureilyticus]
MEKIVENQTRTQLADALIHETMLPITHGIASASLVGAYLDWASHLAVSPGKQRDMLESAARKWVQWVMYVSNSAMGNCAPCAQPQPQDKRFRGAAWGKIPFNWSVQAFLSMEQWWSDAMTDVPGVSLHHQNVAEFVTRQWLDVWSPSNFVSSNPEVLRYTLASGGDNLVRGASNWQRDTMDLLSHRKLRDTETFLPGKDVALTSGKVIYRNHLIELIQYAPTTKTTFPEPVLIVPAWIMKYYILDLSPHNSLVKYLVDHGHTVFMISWNNPTKDDRDLAISDYLDMGIMSALRMIKEVTPEKQIHAVGYCLGGTLLAIAAATLARDGDRILASMTLLASQLDFKEPGQLGLFIDESQIAYLESIMAAQGYLDGRQMAGAFALINSKDLVWSKLVHEYLMGGQTPLTDLRAWNADATRMPYRMHSEYLRKLYLNNDLAEGRFAVNGKPIALQDLRLPIFVVGTESDHVSPWKSVFKVHLLTDCETTYVLTTGGHNVGIVNPPVESAKHTGHSYKIMTRAPEGRYIDPEAWLLQADQQEGSWWPAWQAWLACRSSKAVAALPISEKLSSKMTEFEDAPGRYVGIV